MPTTLESELFSLLIFKTIGEDAITRNNLIVSSRIRPMY